MIITQGLVASLATRALARMQNVYIAANLLYVSFSFDVPGIEVTSFFFCRLVAAIIIALAVATPHEFRNTPKFAFGNFENCKLMYLL